MHKTIIADTSCLIVLSRIRELNLLYELYGEITITTEVANEYGRVLPQWFVVDDPKDQYRQRILELQIDPGEASAIALAIEISDSTIILDDEKARRVARRLGLVVTGTLGVIIRTKLQGLIPSIIPLLEKIKETDFRISEELERQAIREAGE